MRLLQTDERNSFRRTEMVAGIICHNFLYIINEVIYKLVCEQSGIYF
jgi:hypothetical protein